MLRLARIPFALLFLLPFVIKGQNDDKKGHDLAIRGEFQGISASSNELFKKSMSGVIGGDLSLIVPFAGDFFAGGGGRLFFFERAKDPRNLLSKETTMMSYGPFLEAGYQPYLGEIFFIELSIKGSYRFLRFNSPLCGKKGKKEVHTQQTPSAEPQLGFWWDAGDGLKFGAIVGYELMWERFQSELICEDLKDLNASAKGNYQNWNFGFSFSADLK